MKTCVVTANYSCDPNKVWLYLTKPTLNHWRSDVSEYEESDDGLKGVEHNTDAARPKSFLPARTRPATSAATSARERSTAPLPPS